MADDSDAPCQLEAAPAADPPPRAPARSTSSDAASGLLVDHLTHVVLPNPRIPFQEEPHGRLDESLSSSTPADQHPHRLYGDEIDRLRYVIFAPDLNQVHADRADTFLQKSLSTARIDAIDRAVLQDRREDLTESLPSTAAKSEARSSDKVRRMGLLLKRVVKILDEVISRGGRNRSVDFEDQPESHMQHPGPDLAIGEIVREVVWTRATTFAVCKVNAFTAGMFKSGIAWRLHEQLIARGVHKVKDVEDCREGWTEETSRLILRLASAAMERDVEYMFIVTGAGYQMGKLRETGASDSEGSKIYDLLVGPVACFKYDAKWQPPTEGEGGIWANNSEHQNEPSLMTILLGLFFRRAFDGVDETYRDRVDRASTVARRQEEEERPEPERTTSGGGDANSTVEECTTGDGEEPGRTPLHTFKFADGCVPARFYDDLKPEVPRAFADTLARPTGLTRDVPSSPARFSNFCSSRSTTCAAQTQPEPSSEPSTLRSNSVTTPSASVDDNLVTFPAASTTRESDSEVLLRRKRPRTRVKLDPTIELGKRFNSARTLTSDAYRSIPPGFVVKFAKNDRKRHVEAENEASLLLNHLAVDSLRPFVIQLLYFAKNPDNRYDKVVSVFEDGGDALESWSDVSVSDDDKHHLAVGLHLVHLHGVQHNDLKPANAVRRRGERPKLIDFGNARSRHDCPVGTCEELSEFLDDLCIWAEVDRAAVQDRARRLFFSSSA
ncbi:hypothetical protein JCM11491_001782 [Sporobolomyces phaffii]